MDDPILLSTAVPAEAVDDVTGRAWLAGATGVAEEHIAGDDQVRLLVACHADDQAAVASALGGDAQTVESWTPVVKRVSAPFGDRVIDLDVPANVFGDGTHQTTAACLGLLTDLVAPGDHVLDLGCGAGLLSVAAALLGARVTALDIWEPAVAATTVNVERAGVGAQVSTAVRSIEPTDRADIVLANIGAATLVELAPLLLGATTGPIVLSGFLIGQADEVVAAYLPRQEQDRTVDGVWATVTLAGATRTSGAR